MQSWSRGISSEMTTILILTLLSVCSVGGQFYSDYGDSGGGISGAGGLGGGFQLNPFDIPVIYKQRTYPAAYPVAPTIYQVALMKPIEPMPGKKTVPLYMIPEDSLLVNPNNVYRAKRSIDPHGVRVNIHKYPEFYGLTDGYHIPAVEIPLNKPMIIRQIEVNVLAPEGFMVPFQSEDRQWPYPMTTGCLVAAIPRNTYVSEDHPFTIRRLFAVPSLPEYPTYRQAFPNPNQLTYPGSVPQLQHHSHSHPSHGDGVTLNFFPNGQQGHPHTHTHPHPHSPPSVYAHPTSETKQKGPVFELVPVTPKSNRRNGSRRRNGKQRDESDEDSRKRDRDSSDEDDDKDSDDSSSKDSREDDSEEDEKRDRRRCNDREGSRSGRRNCSGRRSRDRNSTTRKTTTTTGSTTTSERTTTTPTTTRPTTTTTTTTTTAPPTTPAASSIQDIIAAFSSYRDHERKRDDRRDRGSASFYEEEERERRTSDRVRDRDRDRSEGLRSGNSASSPPRERNRGDRDDEHDDRRNSRNNDQSPPSPPPQSFSRDQESNRGHDSRTSSSVREAPSENNLQELREQVLQKQINQLQLLLSSLNLTQDSNAINNGTSQQSTA